MGRPVQLVAFLRFALVLAVMILCGRYLSQIWGYVIYTPTNGTFQIFDPIWRLSDGQMPGRDFQPYMGVGLTYFTALATWALGGSFASSILAGQALRLIFYGLYLAFLLYAIRLPGLMKFMIWALGMLVALGLTYGSFSNQADGWDYQLFGHVVLTLSDQGLRAGLPALTAAAMFGIGNLTRHDKVRYPLFLGLLGGLQPFWSNDFGIASTIALVTAFFIFAANRQNRTPSLSIFIVAAIAGFFTFGLAMTGGALFSWIDYNFLGVASDQKWYFSSGSEDAGSYVSYILHLPYVTAALMLTPCVLWHFARKLYRQPQETKSFIGFYLALTATLVTLIRLAGGTSEVRIFSPMVLTIFVLSIEPVVAAWRRFSTLRPTYPVKLFYFLWSLSVAGTVFAMSESMERWENYHWGLSPMTEPSPEFGGVISKDYIPAIDLARKIRNDTSHLPAERRIFSTYATGMDFIIGTHQPTGFDYIIHAIGTKARDHYLHTFKMISPRYVTTIRRDFVVWGRWNWYRNWWFHREMLRNYQPVYATIYNIIWEPRQQPLPVSKPVECRVVRRTPTAVDLVLSLPSSDPDGDRLGAFLVDVDLHYQVSGGDFPASVSSFWSSLIYATDAKQRDDSGQKPMALPLDNKRWPLLIWLRPDTRQTVVNLSLTPESRRLDVSGCSATISAREADLAILEGRQIASTTQEGWVNGIRAEPTQSMVALVATDSPGLENVIPGQTWAILKQSGWRRVKNISGSLVTIDGELSPADGYPNTITFVIQ